jgi:UPF0755 protein
MKFTKLLRFLFEIKWPKKLFNINVFFALLLSTGIIIYTWQSTDPNPKLEIVYITEPSNKEKTIEKLMELGLIKNPITYMVAYIISKFSIEPEPGAYYFRSGMTALAINAKLKDPDYKYIFINEGMRKEQIADLYAKKLNWSAEQKDSFAPQNSICLYAGREGYLSPGEYLVPKNAPPQDILVKMEEKFYQNFKNISDKKKNIIDQEQIVKIASLIQKEAAGKNDMRLISGIIWNRLFEDMPLQIDATLQYLRGNENNWWPVPKSEDKFLESPFNTYQNKGLPPTAIANPGPSAIEAAINPVVTSCLFYIHDKRRNIHCSSDYKGHLANIKRYL